MISLDISDISVASGHSSGLSPSRSARYLIGSAVLTSHGRAQPRRVTLFSRSVRLRSVVEP